MRKKLPPNCRVCNIEIPEEKRYYDSKGFLSRLCLKCSKKINRRRYKKLSDFEKKAKHLQSTFSMLGHGKKEGYTVDYFRKLLAIPNICEYCKLPIKISEFSVDHKIPLSREGTNDINNLHLVCLSCNLLKSNLTDFEFKKLLTFLDNNSDLSSIIKTRLKASNFIYKRWGRQ